MLLRFIGKDIQNIRVEDWLDSKLKELKDIAIRWLGVIKSSTQTSKLFKLPEQQH